jgi:hypothetical protein
MGTSLRKRCFVKIRKIYLVGISDGKNLIRDLSLGRRMTLKWVLKT